MSTSFHPQMDGLTERANRSIAQILQAFIAANQRDWVCFLALVEFAINSTINRAMGMAPFEINYGFLPCMMQELPAPEYIPPGVWTFAMNALCNMAIVHDSIIAERVFQHFHANKHQHGKFVYLSTKNLAMPKGCTSKLLPKFVGPIRFYRHTQTPPTMS